MLKFLQHSLNLTFFCNHRLFITVLRTASLTKPDFFAEINTNYLKESQYTTYVDTIFCYFHYENFLIFRPCFIHIFFEVQCNIMDLIEQSTAAMVASRH